VKLLLVILVLFVVLFIATTRKAGALLGVRTRRMLSVPTPASPDESLKAIIRFAQQSGYKVAAIQETEGLLVLDESISLMTWGFYFPVRVSQQADGLTLVEVGIRSKLFQVGPIVSRTHEKCVAGIRAALFARAI
jgi:hypothetical protein